MRTRLQTIAFALAVCALLSTSALAGVKSRNVKFDTDVTIGDTLIEKGNYKVTFDDAAQELTISKGNKVVAKTPAALSELKRSGKYRPVYDTLKDASGTILLSTVDMGGKYAVINGEKIAAARTASKDGQ